MRSSGRYSSREPLDAITDSILSRLKQLDWRRAALFSAAVAERFSLFYEVFALKHDLEKPLVFRRAVDAVWRFLETGDLELELRRELVEIECAIPSPGDYDSLESVLAHDACIAIDAAIRSCLEPNNADPVAGEYGIETLRVAVSYAETGFYDVGNGSEFSEFLAKLPVHPIIAKEIELQQSDLTMLESDVPYVLDSVFGRRKLAEDNRVEVAELLRELSVLAQQQFER